MINQKRNMVSTTKNRPVEGLLIVQSHDLDINSLEVGQFSHLLNSKSSLWRSFAGLEALIRTFFVIQEWIIDQPLSTTTKDSRNGCLREGLVPRSAIKATLGKWGSYRRII